MKEEEYLINSLSFADTQEKKDFYDLVFGYGLDKTIECLNIYKSLTKEKSSKVPFSSLVLFTLYEHSLSTVLFEILRVQEDYVKAFLSNYYNNVKLAVEARPSNYSKIKYYFKFPYGNKNYLDIRTFNYSHGPVDSYDAIKTLDFGDINVIFSHLPKSAIKEFSNNPNILDDLDKTRQLRNYVYHHNLLFSFGKDLLKNAIILVLGNIVFDESRNFFIKTINDLRYIDGHDVGEDVAIYLDEKDIDEMSKFH